ncbi:MULTISPECIES: ribosome maturation factor RimP [Sporomusa]|jgi:ribosome maturation factor RimP|uniref:Ribosome maturation factor RimP n=1 Tax=Sporomusa sphaeroides DSM 2875 TaxID=1337886 RepID=A0ABP2C1W5_9FIRM|nr:MULTISPECIES: ribosome maturation factor RimP [Sporomusa]MCM0760149.1 ribosome maturation factor RimP [Sporomusa sphaeroides DSM 2875]OLS58202.1 ribosome maturation factor RimP [Sporomusa sphaeroides DSM 2875]CVK17611.1 Ribosome maturation factor RimP [Sporomusa sphaeroides DSM 2875]HML31535.1 ribosome maturation factor RimP [Sporomusa sphaeroides]
MSKEKIESVVEKLVSDIIADSKLELVDVEYVKEHDWYLRVFLDKESGIEIDDCQWVSEQLEAKLDESNLIKDHYYLEVSSPGLDRPLKKERDFVRHAGDKVEVKTYEAINGQKVLVGNLLGLIDGEVRIDIAGQIVNIPREKAAQIRLHIEF